MKIVMKSAEILAIRLRKTHKDLPEVHCQLDRPFSQSEKGPVSLEDYDGKDKSTPTGQSTKATSAKWSAFAITNRPPADSCSD